MCSNGFRILIMFLFTAVSFVLNNFFSSIPVVVWYLVSINIFTFLLMFADKMYQEKKRVPQISLIYFSIIGGVFGTVLGYAIFKYPNQNKYFAYIQLFILILWIVTIVLILKNLELVVSTIREIGGK